MSRSLDVDNCWNSICWISGRFKLFIKHTGWVKIAGLPLCFIHFVHEVRGGNFCLRLRKMLRSYFVLTQGRVLYRLIPCIDTVMVNITSLLRVVLIRCDRALQIVLHNWFWRRLFYFLRLQMSKNRLTCIHLALNRTNIMSLKWTLIIHSPLSLSFIVLRVCVNPMVQFRSQKIGPTLDIILAFG